MTGLPGQEAAVVLLCTDDDVSRAVYHALRARLGRVAVIVEEPVSRVQLLRRRARTLGLPVVIGQLLFIGAVLPVLRAVSRERVAEIRTQYGLRDDPMHEEDVTRVSSVNSAETRDHLRGLAPKVVVVNGTRILSAETLGATDAAFVNTHLGVTPLYRGVHGGYWALAENRHDLVGTTIHYVDRGIDTGGIIQQIHFAPGPRDNFVTYPHLHIGTALPSLVEVVAMIADGGTRPPTVASALPSRLRSHPTLAQYLRHRIRHGVR